jgi:uncharacterized membrane protein YhfC
VAAVIHRRTGARWGLFFIGAITFTLSQVLHIPFNWAVEQTGLLPSDLSSWSNLIIYAAFLGLSAGVFEETARYLAYRYWAKDARSWSRGLMLGAGHGGIEAILLGLLGAVGFVGLVLTANNQTLMSAIPEEQRALIAQGLSQIIDAPWYMMLLGAVERVFAILAHLAMSLLVLQVFLRRSILWLFLSIAYHTALNMIAVIAAARLGAVGAEASLAVFSLLSLFVIFRLRGPEPVEAEPPPPIEPLSAAAIDLQPTAEALDRSRYN